jgi:ribosomal protein L25 (general stress protein Ctc)
MSINVECKTRPENSKPRALRREGLIPGVLYGHNGTESLSLTMTSDHVTALLKKASLNNTLIDLNDKINKLNNTISELDLIDYSNKVYNNENVLKLKKKVDISLNSFFSYLKTKNNNPELTYGKIKYRELEHEKLNNLNKLLDLLFYCFYFVFIIIIIFTGKIKREYFLIYGFIGIIPFIFPIVIKITKNINIRFDIFNGKKNAFIEDDTEYIDAYNI